MEKLFAMAVEAFSAIEKNTGVRLWTPPENPSVAGVRDALDAFGVAFDRYGLAWIIDSATGIGLSHLGLSYWLEEARKLAS